MWLIFSICLVMGALVHGHHDGTDHAEGEEHPALIMLEIQPNIQNSSASKDKRQTSQAIYGASPGEFTVRQPEVPAEYLSLLQQLVAQQQQDSQSPQQPVIHQLLVARNPDPSAVQFSSSQPQRPRRPPSPQAQLQQLYFDRQFQQQIPVRPRLLRPPPRRPATPPQEEYSPSQAHDIHEARLRASLAGSDPNQQVFPTTVGALYNQQQLGQLSTSQDQVTQLQSLPQPSFPPQQAYTAVTPQPVQRAASYPTSNRQAAPSSQHKPSHHPPQQYHLETTQSLPEQTPQHQTTSDPKVYLASEYGQQKQVSSEEDELISQLLSGGRGLFPSSTPSPANIAEEVIRSTTALPPTPSRSSIYVTQTAKVKSTPSSGRITIEEVGESREGAQTPLPVVHLPTPEGQRPLTQSELQALLDAGFNISPAPQETEPSPQYYTVPKQQRSYSTPAPPARNQVAYRGRQKKPEEIRYAQQEASQESTQQKAEVKSRYRLQGSKPQEEETVQYEQRPASLRQGSQYSRFRIVVGKPEEQETYEFIQIPTTPEAQEQRAQFITTYEPEEERTQQTTQLYNYQEERRSTPQESQAKESSEAQEPSYQLQQAQVRRFHPIVVADLPSTTPVPSSQPRRRKQRPPTHSRIVFRSQNQPSEELPQQPEYLSYDNVPEASSFGSRNNIRGQKPSNSFQE